MALHLLDVLDQSSFEVYLFTIDATHEMSIHSDIYRARKLSANIFPLSSLDTNASTLFKIFFFPWQYFHFHYHIRKLKLDLIISFEDRANIFNMLTIAHVLRIISIRHPMLSVLFFKQPLKRFLIDKFFRFFLPRVDIANFNSQGSQDEFQRYFRFDPKRISVIHNFCNHQRLKVETAKDCIPKKGAHLFQGPVIIACGRFKPVKGFHRLIRSFQIVNILFPEARLVILGDGPLMTDLKKTRHDLGLDDVIHFPGFAHNTAAWIQPADIFVLSSLSEGFPNVLLEAMALKVPVVSTDCIAGPRELLAPKTDFHLVTKDIEYAEFGILLPPLDRTIPSAADSLDYSEHCMAEALITLLKDNVCREYYSHQAYLRSYDFSVEKQMKCWFILIERLYKMGF